MMEEEITDEEIEAIHDAASEAAIHAWGPAGNSARNPYPPGSERADIWSHAFRNEYARQNGY